MMRRLIRADGTEQEIDRLTASEIRKLIGADALDCVALRHLGYPLQVMVVDDAGYETEIIERATGDIEIKPIRPRKPLNEKASALYHANCRPGTTYQIAGDVVIVPDSDFA